MNPRRTFSDSGSSGGLTSRSRRPRSSLGPTPKRYSDVAPRSVRTWRTEILTRRLLGLDQMIDAALSLYTTDDRPPQRILDLGTGSGCILLSLLSEFKEARGVGVDRSPQALQVARINAHRMRLTERSTFIERYATDSTSSSLTFLNDTRHGIDLNLGSLRSATGSTRWMNASASTWWQATRPTFRAQTWPASNPT